jgi:hypothetical protein
VVYCGKSVSWGFEGSGESSGYTVMSLRLLLGVLNSHTGAFVLGVSFALLADSLRLFRAILVL